MQSHATSSQQINGGSKTKIVTREEVERYHIRFVELYKLVLKFKKLGRAEMSRN